MDLVSVRDIVVVVVGIIWTILFLVLLAAVVVVYALVSKYLGKARTILHERGGAIMDQAQTIAETVRARTATLPGHPRPEGAEVLIIAGPGKRQSFSFPFFRRRKWWERLIPQ